MRTRAKVCLANTLLHTQNIGRKQSHTHRIADSPEGTDRRRGFHAKTARRRHSRSRKRGKINALRRRITEKTKKSRKIWEKRVRPGRNSEQISNSLAFYRRANESPAALLPYFPRSGAIQVEDYHHSTKRVQQPDKIYPTYLRA